MGGLVHVHMYTYMYICVYMYVYMFISAHTHIHMYMYSQDSFQSLVGARVTNSFVAVALLRSRGLWQATWRRMAVYCVQHHRRVCGMFQSRRVADPCQQTHKTALTPSFSKHISHRNDDHKKHVAGRSKTNCSC